MLKSPVAPRLARKAATKINAWFSHLSVMTLTQPPNTALRKIKIKSVTCKLFHPQQWLPGAGTALPRTWLQGHMVQPVNAKPFTRCVLQKHKSRSSSQYMPPNFCHGLPDPYAGLSKLAGGRGRVSWLASPQNRKSKLWKLLITPVFPLHFNPEACLHENSCWEIGSSRNMSSSPNDSIVLTIVGIIFLKSTS